MKDLIESQFVADALIAYIRAGSFPEDEDAEMLNQRPLIDALRERVEDKDVPQLQQIAEESSGAKAVLACSLLRKPCLRRDDLKGWLRSTWEAADSYLRCQLLWRLLDDPDLPEEWHRKLFDFVLSEWDTFKYSQLKFWGNQPNLLRGVLRHLADIPGISGIRVPKTKKWAYLCCAALLDDRLTVKALLHIGDRLGDSFIREVARTLLDRLEESVNC